MKKKYFAPEMEEMEIEGQMMMSDSSPCSTVEGEVGSGEVCDGITITDF